MNKINKFFVPKKMAQIFISGALSFTLVGCGINEVHNDIDNEPSAIQIEDNFPIQTEYLNQLSKQEKQDYYRLNQTYRDLLVQYINSLGLKKYDDELKNSEFKFLEVANSDKDYYQYHTKDLSYYYIRNDLYIERLNQEDLNYLKMINSEDPLDNEKIDFIKRTYPMVIKKYLRNDENLSVFYGPISSLEYSAPNDALVIGCNYDRFNSNGVTDEEWDKNFQNQVEMLNENNKQLEAHLKGQLNVPVKLIQYDEYSVYPMNNTVNTKVK